MADAAIPGYTASPELEAKLDSLDDNLNPISKEVVEDEPKDAKEETEQKNEAVEQVEEAQEADKSQEGEDDSSESEDEGYTIDDESEDNEEVVAETPTQTETVKRSDLTPEQQYILDNITAIKVRGSVGDGPVQEYEVLSPEQLPNGFNYVDQREMSIANKNFALLESKAVELQNDFRSQESAKAAQQFKELEDNADRADINELQKEGELPKFKTAPDSKDFEKDPATVMIQEVLDFKENLNQRYMDEYNAGRPYRHVGFMEAYAMWRRQNPKVSPEQVAEDAERKNIARRTSGTKSRTAPPKPNVTRGMTSRDLDRYLENLDI